MPVGQQPTDPILVRTGSRIVPGTPYRSAQAKGTRCVPLYHTGANLLVHVPYSLIISYEYEYLLPYGTPCLKKRFPALSMRCLRRPF
eukprot:scaffold298021_cov34-Prasinocladus_malaysianus.AAC.1